MLVGLVMGGFQVKGSIDTWGEAQEAEKIAVVDAITHGGGGDPHGAQDDFTVSSIIPEQQSAFDAAPHQAPMRTAAELGFDDSRYETPADPGQLDPVNRSLMREERRAALEAQTGVGGPFADNAQEQQGYAPESYAGGPYGDQQQPQQGYAEEQYGQDQYGQQQRQYQGSYEQQQYGAGDGYPQQGQQQPQDGYAESAYAVPEGQQGPYADAYPVSADPSHQDDWPVQNGYEPIARTEPESVPSTPAEPSERVGFDRPGPTPNVGPELTEAGLPRRGGQQHWQPGPGGRGNDQPAPAQRPRPQQEQRQDPQTDGDGPDDWRSTNDERWERAEKLREPKAGGITPSGLPRRVPKANLVEGTAEQTQQGGPQVSRAPEDVRGRLSNLRRGIQRGRSAGSDTSTTYNQER
ncbi:ATPase [Streptomyces badius]